MMMKLSRLILFFSPTWWIEQSGKTIILYHRVLCNNGYCVFYTDSLCSLQLAPRTGDVGIIVDCGNQCTLASSFLYHGQCTDLFSALGIQRCNQQECSPKIYNLSACITAETEINTMYTTNQNANCQCNRDRDAVTNSIASTYIPTINVYRTDTINRTEAQNINCTTKPQSNKEGQYQVIIRALVGLLAVLLVVVIIPWIWICWKVTGGLNRNNNRQGRTI